jgi:hypothetical protein
MDPALIAFFALVLTSPGATVASGVIRQVVEGLKMVAPSVVTGKEKIVAFAVTIALVTTALIVGIFEVPPRYLLDTPLAIAGILFVWLGAVYNIGRLAMAIEDDVSAKPGSLREPSPEELAAQDAETAAAIPTAPPAPPVDQPGAIPGVPGDTP